MIRKLAVFHPATLFASANIGQERLPVWPKNLEAFAKAKTYALIPDFEFVHCHRYTSARPSEFVKSPLECNTHCRP